MEGYVEQKDEILFCGNEQKKFVFPESKIIFEIRRLTRVMSLNELLT